MMKMQQIRDMKAGELRKFVEEKRAEAVKLRFDISARQAKNNRAYRAVRKEIARALTALGRSSEME